MATESSQINGQQRPLPNNTHDRSQLAGAAYRPGHPAPLDFLTPPPPASHTFQPRTFYPDDERGLSDSGRLQFPGDATTSYTAAKECAMAAAANDEAASYFWTFNSDGQPVISRFDVGMGRKHGSSSSSPTSPETRGNARPFPPAGNRGLKLKPVGSLDLQHPNKAVEPHRRRFVHAIEQTDDTIASHAPKWNAYGRLAPWTSGATGPLTGQGEEEVGPSGIVGGEEGEVGERRPRRGDMETNDRLRLRIAALQRAGVRSLLTSPPPRREHIKNEDEDGLRDGQRSPSPLLPPSPKRQSAIEEEQYLTTALLAPRLLHPVLSPIDLLQSRTLQHTFRNPHISALAKTTLDLSESEGEVVKSVGGFWAALELDESSRYRVLRPGDQLTARDKRGLGDEQGGRRSKAQRERERKRKAAEKEAEARPPTGGRKRARTRTHFSPSVLGSAGAGGRADHANAGEVSTVSFDELNPTFMKLDDLFITPNGLPIPVVPPPGSQSAGEESFTDGMASGVAAEAAAEDESQGNAAGNQPAEMNESSATKAAQASESKPEGQASQSEAGDGNVRRPEEANQAEQQQGGQASQDDQSMARDNDQPPDAPAESLADGAAATSPDAAQEQQLSSAAAGADGSGMTLSPQSQREILLASLSCLHDLASDSSEYLDRLNEVRGMLCQVKRKRDRVWRALRIWALQKLDEDENDAGAAAGANGARANGNGFGDGMDVS